MKHAFLPLSLAAVTFFCGVQAVQAQGIVFPPQTPAAPAAPPAPATPVPIEGLWRSDAGLESAGDLIKQKKYADALLVLEQITRRNIRNADAHVYTAICWTNLGDLQKAKTILANAFAIDKGHMGAYLVAGLIALAEDNVTQAEYYMGALRTVCQSELCPEFQILRKFVTEHQSQ